MHRKIRQLGLEDKVFLHEEVPHAKILHYMASCDIGTAFYRNTNMNNYYCASNKIYEYIALGKEILTNNYPGLLEVVAKNGYGICLEEVTAQSLAEAYRRCMTFDRRSQVQTYFWEDNEYILLQLYDT
jgi:starch synthase